MYKFRKLYKGDVLFESTVIGRARMSIAPSLHRNCVELRMSCRTVDDSEFITIHEDLGDEAPPEWVINLLVDALYEGRQKEFKLRMNREYYGYFEG